MKVSPIWAVVDGPILAGHGVEEFTVLVEDVRQHGFDAGGTYPAIGRWNFFFPAWRRAPSMAAAATRISRITPAVNAAVVPIPYGMDSSPEPASR